MSVPLWVNSGVLSDEELGRLRAAGFAVTNFTRVIDPADDSAVNEALATIKEHHPSECIRVER